MRSLDDAARTAAFDRYASWYDAFNEGKDYEAEVRYLLRRIGDFATSPPRRWLDIGCGTGHHLACLHSRAIAVEGVDLSPAMVAHARHTYPQIPFHTASAQTFQVEGDRDVVSMLFHVMNYQVSDAMVRSAMERVAAHLAPLGMLVFDFWNSEAVVKDPPRRRVREIRIDGRPLFRLAIPTEDRDRRRVDVLYQFRWDSPEGDLVHEEVHALRHFVKGELESFLAGAGMTLLLCDNWMRDRRLSSDDWYGFICARPERSV